MDASLIYNQENLPLSPKKFVKKFLARILRGGLLLFPLTILIGFFVGFFTLIKSSSGSQFPSLVEFIFSNNIQLVILAVIILWLLWSLIYEYLYYRLYAYSFGDDSAEIKKGVIINTGAIVEHECIINDYAHIAPGAVLAGSVFVGANSFIGANAVVKQGVKIGKNVISIGKIIPMTFWLISKKIILHHNVFSKKPIIHL